MEQRNRFLIAIGIGVLLIIALIAALMGRSRPGVHVPVPDPVDVVQPDAIKLTRISLDSAPDEVREAAKRLASSRVGYAIVRPEKTYLIISTGSDHLKLTLDRAEGQPEGEAATFVDLHLKADPAGDRLLIATTDLKAGVEYQFNVDGEYAAIPTLHNRHNLPLTHLDADIGFTLLTPQGGDRVMGSNLRLEGFARVFEAQFTASLITVKGRELVMTPVMAAAGAPNWGSFVVDINLNGLELPESCFLVLAEEMTGAELVIPVGFQR